MQATLVASPDDPIALDGKTVRGAKSGDQHAPHLLSFRTHNSQETLLQVEVDKKTNEMPVANLNTLIYLIINARALAKARSINKGLLHVH